MALSGKLKAAATATTNPDPTTLGTPSPYGTSMADRYKAQAAWATQAATNCSALIDRGHGGIGLVGLPPRLGFIPSGGNAVTYTVTIWSWNQVAQQWAKIAWSGGSMTLALTGFQEILLVYNQSFNAVTDAPFWIQLSGISAGTIDIYYDSGVLAAV